MTAPSTGITNADVRPIHRWLQINVCALCMLSGLAFALAEGYPLALLSLPLAVAGLLFVDRRDAAGLSPLWANALGLAAFVAAGYEFFGESPEGRLLGFGHLLVYLTWILLLQKKGNPQFWWLCALSVLQMATASVLTNDLWFPLTAVLYMLLALWTLSVFSLDRAVTQASGVVQSARRARGTSPAEIDSTTDSSRSRSNVQTEAASRWITPRFVTGVFINGVLSLLLGLAIFVLVPRIWAGSLQFFSDADAPAAHSLTGFAEEVSLGDLGEILENPSLVLEVEFYNHHTDKPLDVEAAMTHLGYDAPMFRGKVLGRYANGRWSPAELSAPVRRAPHLRKVPLIRQEIHLQPIGTRTLFAADHPVDCRTREDVTIEHELFNDTFELDASTHSRQRLKKVFPYTAYSSLTGETAQLKLPARSIWRLQGSYQREMLTLPDNLERMGILTRQLIRTEDATILSQAEIARTLVDYLRNSGQFSYSLKVSVDDPTIDPVEDFLFNRKQGHCEYYASALALMLRAAGIPSRLISGFKGGKVNEVTGKFEVRQLHAHAWVEALIDEKWVVLDATPASRDASVAQISTNLNPFVAARRYLQSWWSQGLMMNQAQQQRAIYDPLRDLFQGWVKDVRRVGLLQTLKTWLSELSANPQEWISIRGFVTAFILLLLLASLVWLARRCWNLMRGLSLGGRARKRQQRQVVEFYERFRTLLARRGYVRSQTATQREFAARIEQDWQQRPGVDGLAGFPTRLTDAFYRVRFGNTSLSADELQSLDASLTRLEAWLRQPTATPEA